MKQKYGGMLVSESPKENPEISLNRQEPFILSCSIKKKDSYQLEEYLD